MPMDQFDGGWVGLRPCRGGAGHSSKFKDRITIALSPSETLSAARC